MKDMKPSEYRKAVAKSRSAGGKKGAESRRISSKTVDSYLPHGEYGTDRVRPWEM